MLTFAFIHYPYLVCILFDMPALHLLGVSNHWTGIWNETMEWKMEWNSECTQLQVTCVTVAAQSRLNYLVYLQACYLTAEAL